MTRKTARKGTVVEHVLEDLKALLRRRRYGAGRRLPGERTLAHELGVSRPSLREALRTLERMGVLDIRHGAGTRVARSGADVLRAPLEFLFMLEKPAVADLHETRTLLEVHLAGRAATSRDERDLAELDRSIAGMKDALGRPADLTPADVRFHQALAAAAHNPVLERLMNGFRDAFAGMIAAAWPGAEDLKATLANHAGIVEAVRRRDAGAARRLMTESMDLMGGELRRVRLLP